MEHGSQEEDSNGRPLLKQNVEAAAAVADQVHSKGPQGREVFGCSLSTNGPRALSCCQVAIAVAHPGICGQGMAGDDLHLAHRSSTAPNMQFTCVQQDFLRAREKTTPEVSSIALPLDLSRMFRLRAEFKSLVAPTVALVAIPHTPRKLNEVLEQRAAQLWLFFGQWKWVRFAACQCFIG